jgi:hypothetical protein
LIDLINHIALTMEADPSGSLMSAKMQGYFYSPTVAASQVAMMWAERRSL